MSEPKVAFLALSAALLIPQGIRAQVTSGFEARAITTESATEAVPASMLSLAPTVLVRHQYLTVNARAAAWLHQQQWQLADGIVSGTLVSPTIYGVRTQLIANASRAFDDRSLGGDQLDVETRIHFQYKQSSGAWVGGGIARPWRIAEVSSVDLAGGGAWMKLGSAMLTTTLSSLRFTKTIPLDTTAVIPCGRVSAPVTGARPRLTAESTPCRRQTRVNDVESSLRWAFRGIEFSGQGGYRFGDPLEIGADSRQWLMGTATIWITPRVAFVTGGGRQPANLARAIPARSFMSVGMTLATWSSPRGHIPVAPARRAMIREFGVRPVQPGTHRIQARVRGVESVEIMGTFSDWQPVSLVRRDRELWEISVPMGTGVHEINIRIDGGEWMTPPGLPTKRDAYGGEVGVVMVRK